MICYETLRIIIELDNLCAYTSDDPENQTHNYMNVCFFNHNIQHCNPETHAIFT